MEGPKRCPPSQIVRRSHHRARVRRHTESHRKPKSAERGPTIRLALAGFLSRPKKHQIHILAEFIAEAFGDLKPHAIGQRQVGLINAYLERYENPFTKSRRAAAARAILRHLEHKFGAPELAHEIAKAVNPKPRNVTATDEERRLLIATAPPHLRCWLMMCSDLAIRGGTAARLGPNDYDREARILTFRTKYQNAQQVPVTAELHAIFETCTDKSLPFVSQLPRTSERHPSARDRPPLGRPTTGNKLGKLFKAHRERQGVTRKLTAHDLRRTTARNVYAITRDLRTVQALLGHSDLPSTVWYLQDNLTTIPVTALELAKLPPTTEKTQ